MWRTRAVWVGLDGSSYLSTFYLDQALNPLATDARNTTRGFLAALSDAFSADMTVNVEAEVARFSTPDQIEEVVATPVLSTIVGNAGTLELARATQGLIQWRTNIYVQGREIRGKMFVPAPTQGSLGASGRPLQDYLDLLQGAANILVSFGHHVASRTNNLFYETASAIPWTEYAVLRSRRD